jgi:hypothetical protein
MCHILIGLYCTSQIEPNIRRSSDYHQHDQTCKISEIAITLEILLVDQWIIIGMELSMLISRLKYVGLQMFFCRPHVFSVPPQGQIARNDIHPS